MPIETPEPNAPRLTLEFGTNRQHVVEYSLTETGELTRRHPELGVPSSEWRLCKMNPDAVDIPRIVKTVLRSLVRKHTPRKIRRYR